MAKADSWEFLNGVVVRAEHLHHIGWSVDSVSSESNKIGEGFSRWPCFFFCWLLLQTVAALLHTILLCTTEASL